MPLNFPNSPNTNDTYVSGDTTWIFNGTVWDVVSNNAAITIEANSFSTISVPGQPNVVADSTADTLNFIAGSNVTITTDGDNDAITISSTGGGGGGSSNSFETVAVAGQPNVVAESATDTLTFVAGTGISITTNASTDTLTFVNTVPAGVTEFTQLLEIDRSSLTVDQIYLPAITMLNVTNIGATSYRFDQYGITDNPTIIALNGTTIAFNLNVLGHPFLIQTGAGSNYNTGLIHVNPLGFVSTGAAAQGQVSGTLYWKIPSTISGGYRYQCSAHAPMVGSITIKNFASI